MSGYRKPTVFVNGEQKVLARVVMERALGRPLSSAELVHHINHDPFDNRLENLTIVNRSEHRRIHAEIGESTRLKKIWIFDPQHLLALWGEMPCCEIAKLFGCSERTICRALAKHFPELDRQHGRAWLRRDYYRRPIDPQGEATCSSK